MSGRTKGPRTWPADAHKLIDESIADASYWKAECRKAQDEARHNSEGWNTALDVAGKYLKQRDTVQSALTASRAECENARETLRLVWTVLCGENYLKASGDGDLARKVTAALGKAVE